MYLKTIFWVVVLFTFNQPKAATVGSSPGFGNCDYSTIQAALDANEAEIRVVNDSSYSQNVFTENLIIDHSVAIKGGYNTCSAAALNILGSKKTSIDGSGILGSSVINISSILGLPLTVSISGMKIQGSRSSLLCSDCGHGIKVINQSGLLEIIDSTVENNTTNGNGGGIYVSNQSQSFELRMINSTIKDNQTGTDGYGGGISCAGSNTLLNIRGDSLVTNNTADFGGGIAGFTGCTMRIDSGSAVTQGPNAKGIVANTANHSGGGFFLNSSAQLFLLGNFYNAADTPDLLGNSTEPVTVSSNLAIDGAGIYAVGGASIGISDGLISNNIASNNGGGIYLDAQSSQVTFLTMVSLAENCWNPGSCTQLRLNTSDNKGGGIYIQGGANIDLINVVFDNNSADFATGLYVSSAGGSAATANLEGCYFYNNGNNAVGAYLDNSVIRGETNTNISLLHNTIAGNDINDSSAIIDINGSDLTLLNSIIYNNSETVLNKNGITNTNFNCIITNENSSISPLSITYPNFVDPSNNNYHLSEDSVAIDLCADAGSQNADSDGDIRGMDNPDPNFNGLFDAGADEYETLPDLIFINGFE